MRVDFFPHYPDDYEGIITAIDSEARVFAGNLFVAYSSRLRLCLYWWPRLVLYGLKLLLIVARDQPEAFVTWTHLVLVPIALVRSLGAIRGPKAVLFGFIFTDRSNKFLNWMRMTYFGWLIRRIDVVVCHSSREALQYSQRFAVDGKFVFLPCTVRDPRNEIDDLPAGNSVVCAGKSNRDYDLLLSIAPLLDVPVEIISDASVLQTMSLPPNVRLHSACYLREYRNMLSQAALVFLPLKDGDFSAGQLVLIEAMGLGKAVVVTRSAGTVDYVDDGMTAIFVEPGDVAACIDAIRSLLDDPQRRHALGDRARAEFLNRFEVESVLRQLVALISDGSSTDVSQEPSPALAASGVGSPVEGY